MLCDVMLRLVMLCFVCMYVCMYACMYACLYVCMFVCLYVCMYACMYVCMHFMCIYRYMFIYASIYMYLNTRIYLTVYVYACGLVTVPQIHTSASDSLGWGGVGWGGMITSLAFPHDLDATLYDLHWQFHMILMLRSMIFIGIST